MLLRELNARALLFRDNKFLFFVISGFMATFGNGLIYISMSWLTYTATHQVSSLTTMMLCFWLPGIIGSPVFGYCADRFNRKILLVIANMARGVSVIIFVLLFSGIDNFSIYCLYTVLGIFFSFYMPAAFPFFQEIMDKDKLLLANATVDVMYEVGARVVPGLLSWCVAGI